MMARDFCFWLQGLFELGDVTSLDERQTDLIKRHLAMVFRHEIDPGDGDGKMQEALDTIHEGDAAGKWDTIHEGDAAGKMREMLDAVRKGLKGSHGLGGGGGNPYFCSSDGPIIRC